MSAAPDLIRTLIRSGVRLERRGDSLHVEAPTGTLTADLRQVLITHKAALLGALAGNDDPLADLRARLLALADADAIDPDIVRNLPDADLVECVGLRSGSLRCYVRALGDRDLRERGKVPADETAPALCRSCGPIWLHPVVASVAPLVDGWPQVLGCPWCHVRVAGGYVPRPLVSCGGCQHFIRDAINLCEGMGRCGAGCHPARPLLYPNAQRQCAAWVPGEDMRHGPYP